MAGSRSDDEGLGAGAGAVEAGESGHMQEAIAEGERDARAGIQQSGGRGGRRGPGVVGVAASVS